MQPSKFTVRSVSFKKIILFLPIFLSNFIIGENPTFNYSTHLALLSITILAIHSITCEDQSEYASVRALNHLDILLIFIFLFLILSYFFTSKSFIWLKFLKIGFILLWYLLIKPIITSRDLGSLLFALVVISLLQLALTFIGLSYDSCNRSIRGSFLALCLHWHLVCVHDSLKSDRKNCFLGLAVCTLALGLLFLIEARMGMLISIFSVIYISSILFKNTKITYSWGIYVCLPFLFPLLFVMKANSTYGRMIVLQNSLSMSFKHIFGGVGYDNYSYHLNLYQSNFNNTCTNCVVQQRLSDYITYPYSEVLNILSEFGLVFFTVLLTAMIVVVFFIRREKFLNVGNKERLLVFGFPLVLLLGGSYVLHKDNFVFLFVLFLAFLSSNLPGFANVKLYKNTAFKLIVLSLSFCGVAYEFSNLRKWQVFTHLYNAGHPSNHQLNPSLPTAYKLHPLYNYNLGMLHFNAGKLEEAILYFEIAKRGLSDDELYTILGKCYLLKNDFQKAKQNLITSSGIVPTKIFPKLLLASIYIKEDKLDSARNICYSVVSNPLKVSNPLTLSLYREARLLLDSLEMAKQ